MGGEEEFGELGGGVGPAEVAAGTVWRAEEGAEGGGFIGGLGEVEEGEWGGPAVARAGAVVEVGFDVAVEGHLAEEEGEIEAGVDGGGESAPEAAVDLDEPALAGEGVFHELDEGGSVPAESAEEGGGAFEEVGGVGGEGFDSDAAFDGEGAEAGHGEGGTDFAVVTEGDDVVGAAGDAALEEELRGVEAEAKGGAGWGEAVPVDGTGEEVEADGAGAGTEFEDGRIADGAGGGGEFVAGGGEAGFGGFEAEALGEEGDFEFVAGEFNGVLGGEDGAGEAIEGGGVAGEGEGGVVVHGEEDVVGVGLEEGAEV